SARSKARRCGASSKTTAPRSGCGGCWRRCRTASRCSTSRTAAGSSCGRRSGGWSRTTMRGDKRDRELLRRYHERGDLAAREQLIEAHMSLVRSLARRYSYRGEQLEDLVQIGAIGLIKAIDRFDVNRGVELTTYATPNIIGEIKRHFRDRGWAVRVPRGLQELNVQLSLEKIRSEIAADGDGETSWPAAAGVHRR